MLYPVSMYMKKNSPLTSFVGHFIKKMAEIGVLDIISKRHRIAEPNCKPLQKEAKSLGLEKFASLFVFYFIACVISMIILVIENIIKPKKKKDPKNQIYWIDQRQVQENQTDANLEHTLKIKIHSLWEEIEKSNLDIFLTMKMKRSLNEINSLLQNK